MGVGSARPCWVLVHGTLGPASLHSSLPEPLSRSPGWPGGFAGLLGMGSKGLVL